MTDLGKLPPQDIETEKYVLGSILVNQYTFDNITIPFNKDVFYKPAHQHIASSIIRLSNSSIPIDMISIIDDLKKNGTLEEVGGPYYISTLTSIDTVVNIDIAYRILFQLSYKRSMIRLAHEIELKSYEYSSDIADIEEYLEKELFSISKSSAVNDPKPVKEIMPEVVNAIKKATENFESNTQSGLDTGFITLTKITGGWQKQDLIIIAGRPSMGKTAFAIEFAKVCGKPCLFFSLEMGANQLAHRILSGEIDDYTSSQMRNGYVKRSDFSKIDNAGQIASMNPIYIDDTGGISISEIRKKSRLAKRKYGIEFILVDYLQLITVPEMKGNREQEISYISRSLKQIAKELGVPLIALSQLSRANEQRADKKPMLSDLRESGAIEQDADIVLFAHRPEYYHQEKMSIYHDDEEIEIDTKSKGLLIISKHRNGGLADIVFTHNTSMTKFKEYRHGSPYNDL